MREIDRNTTGCPQKGKKNFIIDTFITLIHSIFNFLRIL